MARTPVPTYGTTRSTCALLLSGPCEVLASKPAQQNNRSGGCAQLAAQPAALSCARQVAASHGMLRNRAEARANVRCYSTAGCTIADLRLERLGVQRTDLQPARLAAERRCAIQCHAPAECDSNGAEHAVRIARCTAWARRSWREVCRCTGARTKLSWSSSCTYTRLIAAHT